MTPNHPTPGDELVERLRKLDLWLSMHYDDEAEEHGCTIDDAITALEALHTRDEAARSSTTEVERLREIVQLYLDWGRLSPAESEAKYPDWPRPQRVADIDAKALEALQAKDHSHAG